MFKRRSKTLVVSTGTILGEYDWDKQSIFLTHLPPNAISFHSLILNKQRKNLTQCVMVTKWRKLWFPKECDQSSAEFIQMFLNHFTPTEKVSLESPWFISGLKCCLLWGFRVAPTATLKQQMRRCYVQDLRLIWEGHRPIYMSHHTNT